MESDTGRTDPVLFRAQFIGYLSSGDVVNAIAYADDIVLIADSPVQLQTLTIKKEKNCHFTMVFVLLLKNIK